MFNVELCNFVLNVPHQRIFWFKLGHGFGGSTANWIHEILIFFFLINFSFFVDKFAFKNVSTLYPLQRKIYKMFIIFVFLTSNVIFVQLPTVSSVISNEFYVINVYDKYEYKFSGINRLAAFTNAVLMMQKSESNFYEIFIGNVVYRDCLHIRMFLMRIVTYSYFACLTNHQIFSLTIRNDTLFHESFIIR